MSNPAAPRRKNFPATRPWSLAGQIRNIAIRDPAAARRWVEDRSVPVPECGCWLWTGTTQTKGFPYGKAWNGERTVVAHRMMWEAIHGSIPTGMLVRHKCDTPLCVNPDHLELGTPAENIADRDRRGRNFLLSQSACKNGHPYTPETTHISQKGHRQCRICWRESRRNYVEKMGGWRNCVKAS